MMDLVAASCTVIYDLLCMKGGGERMGGSCDQGHVKHVQTSDGTAACLAFLAFHWWRYGTFHVPTFLCITQQIMRT